MRPRCARTSTPSTSRCASPLERNPTKETGLVRREMRQVLKKYNLPLTGPPFDNAYRYVRENY